MFLFLSVGEAHRPGLVTIVAGLPAGLAFSADDLGGELARRRMGFGRGNRMNLKQDKVEIMGEGDESPPGAYVAGALAWTI